jgi:hypothetical protein
VQQLLDPTSDLPVWARQIDWAAITDVLRLYSHWLGRDAKLTRVMVGLHRRTHRLNRSAGPACKSLLTAVLWD